MTGETSFPGLEYLPEALPTAEIVVRLIEETVAQTRTDNGRDEQGVEERVYEFLVQPFPAEEPAEDIPAEYESADKQEGVPPDVETEDMEEHGIYVPVDEKKVKHYLPV